MTDERTRIELHHKLEEVLGPVHTDALMAHLPPSGWGDVATKDDLHALQARTRRDFDGFRAVMRAEWDAFRGVVQAEQETFRAGMQHEFDTFRAEMRHDFDTFRTEMRLEQQSFQAAMEHNLLLFEQRLRASTSESLARHTRTVVLTVVFALVGAMLTTASMFLALG